MKYFLVAGNTRVGSTWLTSSLHNLSGVCCTREVRWHMPYQGPALPVHIYIDSKTQSMSGALQAWFDVLGPKHETNVLGAKLKFDPYGYVPPSAFSELRKIIEDDIHMIFLRRPYFEIYETWRAFGIRHLVNPKWKIRRLKAKKNLSEQDQLSLARFQSTHGVPLEANKINLTRNGKILSRLTQIFNEKDDYYHNIINQPVVEAIDDLFVLFFNDVFIWSMVQDHPNVEIIYYRDIGARFASVAQKFVPGIAEEECQDALAHAPTDKIEPDGIQFVFPDDALKAISRQLDAVFNRIVAGELSIEDVVRYNEDHGQIRFTIPGLAAILEAHEETHGLLLETLTFRNLFQRAFRRSEPTKIWVSQRPINIPTAYA